MRKMAYVAVWMAVVAGSALPAATVTIDAPAGTATNALALVTGADALAVNVGGGGGTVCLNPNNTHTGGTTLGSGTLVMTGAGAVDYSPVGSGGLAIGAAALRYEGPAGGVFAQKVTNTLAEGSEAVTTLDVRSDLVYAGTWSQPNGKLTKTGAGTLELVGVSNVFGTAILDAFSVAGGKVRVAGGSTAFSGQLALGTVPGADVAYEQTGGAVVAGDTNVVVGCATGVRTSFTMSGGTFDANGRSIWCGVGSGPSTNTFDISGTASLRNVNFFIAYDELGDSGLVDVTVREGGELGFKGMYRKTGTLNLLVDGGTLVNDNTSSGSGNNWNNWLQNTSAVTVGPKGATFKDGGTTEFYAQIYASMRAAPAEAGETPKGMTFDGGNWAYYAAQDYAGPTVISNGAALFISVDGTIPSGSAVTVARGSMLRNGNAEKTVASLALEDGATLGFASTAKALSVSGEVRLPKRASIALYGEKTPKTAAKNDNGTYALLKVPAAYADALRAVAWSCATGSNKKRYSFTVATSGSTATLSMTIADGVDAEADITVGAGETVYLAASTAIGDRTLKIDGGTLSVGASLTGTGTNGVVVVTNGLLDAANYLRIAYNKADGRFDLYVQDGGIVRAREIAPSVNGTPQNVMDSIHVDGGMFMPVATVGADMMYMPRYAGLLIGAGGLVVDLSDWDMLGHEGWFRSFCSVQANHDPACAGPDGGIRIRGKGGKVLYYFGSSCAGSTLNGGITVEAGGGIGGADGLAGLSVTLLPGSLFKMYQPSTSAQVANLVIGQTGAEQAAAVIACRNASVPFFVVTNSLSIRSPVEFGVARQWNYDMALVSGVTTAVVYKVASPAVDTSLFRLPDGCENFTLSVEDVAIADGDFAGYRAVVATLEKKSLVVTGAEAYPTPVTVSGDASYADIVVGGAWGGAADPLVDTLLTVNGGNVTADGIMYMGYMPALGASAEAGTHQGFFVLNGGTLSVPALYSVWRNGADNTNARYGSDMTVNSGLLDVAGDIRFGFNQSRVGEKLISRLTVNGGRVNVGGTFHLAYVSGDDKQTAPGSVVLNAGEVDVSGVVNLSRSSWNNQGSWVSYTDIFGIWLNGGTLKAENITMTRATAIPKVWFNGGTYMPYGAKAANRTMQNLYLCYVSTNGAVVSTENLPAGATYTIAQPLLSAPALVEAGVVDGGFRKLGAGTLALSGANTYTGPTVVEAGTLVAAAADAISPDVTVATGAALDLGGNAVAVESVTASGLVANGSLTVTKTLAVSEGNFLAVDGDLTVARGAALDFGGAEAAPGWRPVAVVSGTVTVGRTIGAANAGRTTRCELSVADGVVYARPAVGGLVIIAR